MNDFNNKILGGIYGALIGDACGVPYEFKSPQQIPEYDLIDMTPPEGYARTWANIPVGTYSDDGAQILCLLKCLIDNKLTASELTVVLQQWLHEGYMSVDQFTFDVGNQTAAALRKDVVVDMSRLDHPEFNGNGSLMRTLPVAFMFYGTVHDNQSICDIAYEMSGATHPHIRSRLCCVLYSLIASYMIKGLDIWEAVDKAFGYASQIYATDEIHAELKLIRDFEHYECTGSGYVVDCLWTAIKVVSISTSFQDAIKKSIAYGNDTDTTACVAGGLAGIKYGFEGLPNGWYVQLRGRDLITKLTLPLIMDEWD